MRVQFFTTLHSNKLKSKITEKFCDRFEVKLKDEQNMYQIKGNFIPFDKTRKLLFRNQFTVFSLYLYREEKVVKSFFFELLTLDFDRSKVFVRP